MFKRQFIALAAATAVLGLGATAAQAQAQPYPNKPVRMVVGFAAGGSADLVARIIAQQLTAKLGQPFIVENRLGANGILAAETAARAEPDGYTIFVSNSSTVTLNPTLYKNLRYSPSRDFVPLTNIVTVPMIIMVNPDNPATANIKTIADLVDMAKKTQVSYGSAGNGNITHLGFEWLSQLSGVKMTHIPYKGVADTQRALLGKEVTVVLDSPAGITHVKSGKFRPLAVAGLKRMPELPDVPTMDEIGFKDYQVGYWVGLFMRSGTPEPIIQKLYSTIAEVVKLPDVQEKLRAQGSLNVEGPQSFGAAVKAETERLANVVKKAGISVE
ncbi:MAG: tripartite tricarboxylate transporter substrate binding protein [Burkholderiaceae bacterium]|nr:tripartite tricarboxylate transporter substrate binding protein [Burkholderiaceae bacterium]